MRNTYDMQIQGDGGTKVLVVGCVHGDELIGERVIGELRKLNIVNGTLVTVLANTEAMKKGKRFVDQDLNRVFPGDSKGDYEERLAHSLMPILNEADIVLDIHSTTTDTTSAVILTKVNKSIRELVSILSPKRVVVMEAKLKKTALTGYCKAGISFEYGKDKNEKAYRETLSGILLVLEGYGIATGRKKRTSNVAHGTEYFEVLGTLVRPAGFKLEKIIKNFSLVRKGEIIARDGVHTQKAHRNFYPILFGLVSYKEIWGFMARKVAKI